ncbi:MAG: DUF4142 domain-containing protein [Alphaproteobacteria bacterium]|nr:DUF4142 domain-containing protein [Alphaproteobacteria bacterium]
MKPIVLAGFFVLVAGIAFVNSNALGDNDKTEEFIRKAALSNMFEIESSKIASTRAAAPSTKAFADLMISDHTKAGDELKSAVRESNLSLDLVPATLDSKHQDKINSLLEESGEDFDEEYLSQQEDAHEEAVSLFEDYAKDGNNVAIRKFAQDTLPTLRMHKEHADELE